MTEFKKNKIWGCITTSENVERLSQYPFFFANDDHCLVVSDVQPTETVEMTEEYFSLFKEDDWNWIYSIIPMVEEEQKRKYPEETAILEKREKDFLKRFKEELSKWRDENGGKAEQQ